MSLPDSTNLGTLDFVYNGLPFNNEESKTGQNTNSLDFVFNGLPFVGAQQPSTVTFNPTRMFLIF